MFGSELDSERTFDRMRAMRRTRVRRRRVAVIAAVAIVGGVWAGPLAHGGADPGMRSVASHGYVVRDGDTVWSIASRLQAAGDPRQLADAIESANDVEPGALRPGQTLIIPSV
jgi:nucleoid-associated protein YgaU